MVTPERGNRDRVRRECEHILATCAIEKQIPQQAINSTSVVGTGSLVRDFFPNCDAKVHLITSEKVISSDADLRDYSLRFKKATKEDKKSRVPLSKVSNRVIIKSPGLAVIPIDPNKFGFIRKKRSGLLNHRPFTAYSEELKRDGSGTSKFICYVVHIGGESWSLVPLKVMGIADEETCITDLNNRKLDAGGCFDAGSGWRGFGAPITMNHGNETVAVGALTHDDNGQILCVPFSRIDRERIASDEHQPPGEQSPGEQPPGEQPPGEQPPGEQPPGEQPPGEQPPGEQPPGEQPPGEQPPEEQPLGEQPPGEQPPREQPPGEQLPGEQPSGEQPSREQVEDVGGGLFHLKRSDYELIGEVKPDVGGVNTPRGGHFHLKKNDYELIGEVKPEEGKELVDLQIGWDKKRTKFAAKFKDSQQQDGQGVSDQQNPNPQQDPFFGGSDENSSSFPPGSSLNSVLDNNGSERHGAGNNTNNREKRKSDSLNKDNNALWYESMAPSSEFTEGKMNYYKLSRVILDVIPEGLREIFKREWDNRYGETKGEWKDEPKNGMDLWNLVSPRSRRRNFRRFDTFRNGKRAEWDISMLCHAILSFDSRGSLHPRIKSSVEDLRFVRNEFAHLPQAEISIKDFQSKMLRVKNAFQVLGLREPKIPEIGSKEEIRIIEKKIDNIIKMVEELMF